MKTKSNERARTMRGQTHRQQWAIVYQDGTQKRWREYACGRAAVMICGFVALVYTNEQKNWSTPSGTLPVRLLAPGGIIACEHSIKPRTVSDKPAGYPFLTYPVKTRRSRTLRG